MFNELTNRLSKEITDNIIANTSKEFDKRIDLIGSKKELSDIKTDINFDTRIKISIENDLGNNDEFKENSDIAKTEYQKRIDLAKLSPGEWSGEPGESTLTLPTGEKIEYKNGYPKFDEYSKGNVEIRMTSDKDKNWAMAKQEYAKKWSEEKKDGKEVWTPADVAEYKKNNNLVFHECEDMKTCQLISENIHKNAKHSGGRHECKIRGL